LESCLPDNADCRRACQQKQGESYHALQPFTLILENESAGEVQAGGRCLPVWSLP